MMRALSVLMICSLIFISGCSGESLIGDISTSDPIAAVIFETGTNMGEPYSGIVYRKIKDTDKLISETDTPVLLAYLDDSPYSGNAISFIETLADDFRDDLLIVRIFVEISDNPEEVSKLVGSFGVSVFPFFAVIDKGIRQGTVSGYTAVSEEKIIDLIRKSID